MLNYLFHPTKEEKWKKWEDWQIQNLNEIEFVFIDYYTDNYFKIEDCKENEFYPHFGRFSYFLNNKQTAIHDLIHLYDSCKGYARYFTGDPTYIKLIKEYDLSANDKILGKIDFNEFFYDFHKIHAHIVALFSLSSLVMRLVAFHLAKKGKMLQYGIKPLIEISNESKVRLRQCIEIFQRCSNCKRISEKIWGTHDLCYDCHLTKICNKCGNRKEIVYPSNIRLPTCDSCKK